jgi:hypothetical protein
MIRAALLLWALAAHDAAAQPIRLETMALAVKYRGGRFLALEPQSRLALIGKDGRAAARFDLARKLEGLRRYEVLDFALLADGRVAVSAYANYGLGASGPAVLLFDPAAPERAPEVRNIAPARCHRIEGAPEGGFWCLEAADGGIALNYFDDRGARSLVLPAGDLPPPGVGMGEVGMAAPEAGSVFVWLPSRLSVLRLTREGGTGRRWPLRIEGSGKAAASFAVDSDGGVVALLPLRRPPDFSERLDTPYGLFRLDPATGAWTRAAASGVFPRGSALAGAAGGEAWIWIRAERILWGISLRHW